MSVWNSFVNLATQVFGKLGLANGGTNADLSATGGTSQVLKQTSAGAAITVAQLAASDLSNGTTGTGAVVLQDSPTITTKATVSAGTMSAGAQSVDVSGTMVDTASAGVPFHQEIASITPAANSATNFRCLYFSSRFDSTNNFTGLEGITGIFAETRSVGAGSGTVVNTRGILSTGLSAQDNFGTIGSSIGVQASAGAGAATGTITRAVGVLVAAPTLTSATVSNYGGVIIADYSSAGHNTSLLIGTTTVPTDADYAIYSSTTKPMFLGGKITSYNGVATTNNGVPALVAESNLTAQGAAIGATTLYAVPAAGAGIYRVSVYAKLTRAATTSSVLGGTNGLRLTWTDPTDSVAVTSGVVDQSSSSLALNTTQAVYIGSAVVEAKASTNIQYTFDYTSVGATTMQYKITIRVERIG